MKRNFTDTNGAVWTPKITLFEAARIKRNLEVNIEEIDDINRMIQDPSLLCDTLYIVCEEEARGRNISAEIFGKSLLGDAIKDARQALLGAVSDFFEDPRKRTAFLEYVGTLIEEGDKTLDLIVKSGKATKQKIREEGKKFREELQKQLENPTSGEKSGN